EQRQSECRGGRQTELCHVVISLPAISMVVEPLVVYAALVRNSLSMSQASAGSFRRSVKNSAGFAPACLVLLLGAPQALLVRVVLLPAQEHDRERDRDRDRDEDRHGDDDLRPRGRCVGEHQSQASTRSRAAPTPTSSIGMPSACDTKSTYS